MARVGQKNNNIISRNRFMFQYLSASELILYTFIYPQQSLQTGDFCYSSMKIGLSLDEYVTLVAVR